MRRFTTPLAVRLCLAASIFAGFNICPLAMGQEVGAAPSDLTGSITAQTKAERDVEARAEFRAGRAAYDAGDFRGAWEHFRKAYLLSERPELLYNIGQAADRMQHREQALTAFEMYLGELPNAENAPEVRERIAALRGQVPEAPTTEAAHSQEGAQTVEAAYDGDGDESPASAAPMRTGMLLRAGAGLGVYLASWKAPGDTRGSIRGAGVALDLVGAYTVFPGLLVGGAILINYQPSPSFRQGSNPTESMDGQTLWALGPTVLYYVDPQAHGGYAQASLVLTGATKARQEGAVGSPAGVGKASGGAIVLGGGYDVPLDGALSYGIGGRVSLGALSEADITYTVLAITITGNVTWY